MHMRTDGNRFLEVATVELAVRVVRHQRPISRLSFTRASCRHMRARFKSRVLLSGDHVKNNFITPNNQRAKTHQEAEGNTDC